jgi:hypothetical protein
MDDGRKAGGCEKTYGGKERAASHGERTLAANLAKV